MRQVVDASALLAYLRGEPGGELVGKVEGSLCLSSVNLAEADAKHRSRPCGRRRATCPQGPSDRHFDFARSDAARAAALRIASRRYGLSLGDRACLALAQRLVLPVLTADKVWAEIDHGLDVRLIR